MKIFDAGVGKSGSKTMGNYNLMPEMAENETPRSEEGIALGESQVCTTKILLT